MKRSALLLLAALILLATFLAGCGGETPEVFEVFSPGDYIVVNIADSYRLLKIAPVLVINIPLDANREGMDITLNDELKKIQPLIRDEINIVVRVKTEAELKDVGAQDQLRGEITAALQSKLGMTYVTNVYFSDFVVQ